MPRCRTGIIVSIALKEERAPAWMGDDKSLVSQERFPELHPQILEQLVESWSDPDSR